MSAHQKANSEGLHPCACMHVCLRCHSMARFQRISRCATSVLSNISKTDNADARRKHWSNWKGEANEGSDEGQHCLEHEHSGVPAYSGVQYILLASAVPFAFHSVLPFLASFPFSPGCLEAHVYPCCIISFTGTVLFFLFLFLNQICLAGMSSHDSSI